MRGTYRVYQNGKCIAEVENLITTVGKSHIMKYLAGYATSLAEGIAVGTGVTAAATANTALDFEWSRFSVDLVTADYLNTAIVFKGQIPAELSGSIYEIGLWSAIDSGALYDSRLILGFDSALDLWSSGTWQTTTNRIGINSLRLNPAVSATQTSSLVDMNLDLSGYSYVDEFRLAYMVNNAFVASVKVIFHTDASNYFTITAATPAAGYRITSFAKSAAVATGIPEWGTITSIDVQVTSTAGGSGQVDFDGLRIEDKDFNNEFYALISRAVPAAPIVKLLGLPLDFEYSLDISL